MLIVGITVIVLILLTALLKYILIKKGKDGAAAPRPAAGHGESGLERLSDGNRKIQALDDAIAKEPANGQLYFEKYRVLMDLDVNDSWITPLNKAIELGNEEALKERVVLQIAGAFMLIEKYLAGRDYFKALDLIDKEIRIHADDQNDTDRRVAELVAKLHQQRALVIKMTEENKQMSGDAWMGLSDAWLRSKEYAKALHSIEKAIRTDPRNGQYHYKKFIVLQKADNGAAERWREALKQAAAAKVELAAMLMEKINFEGFDSALEAIDAAIKADPDSGDLYFLKANILYALDVEAQPVWMAALLKAAELGSEKAVRMKNAIMNLFTDGEKEAGADQLAHLIS